MESLFYDLLSFCNQSALGRAMLLPATACGWFEAWEVIVALRLKLHKVGAQATAHISSCRELVERYVSSIQTVILLTDINKATWEAELWTHRDRHRHAVAQIQLYQHAHKMSVPRQMLSVMSMLDEVRRAGLQGAEQIRIPCPFLSVSGKWTGRYSSNRRSKCPQCQVDHA